MNKKVKNELLVEVKWNTTEPINWFTVPLTVRKSAVDMRQQDKIGVSAMRGISKIELLVIRNNFLMVLSGSINRMVHSKQNKTKRKLGLWNKVKRLICSSHRREVEADKSNYAKKELLEKTLNERGSKACRWRWTTREGRIGSDCQGSLK